MLQHTTLHCVTRHHTIQHLLQCNTLHSVLHHVAVLTWHHTVPLFTLCYITMLQRDTVAVAIPFGSATHNTTYVLQCDTKPHCHIMPHRVTQHQSHNATQHHIIPEHATNIAHSLELYEDVSEVSWNTCGLQYGHAEIELLAFSEVFIRGRDGGYILQGKGLKHVTTPKLEGGGRWWICSAREHVTTFPHPPRRTWLGLTHAGWLAWPHPWPYPLPSQPDEARSFSAATSATL